MADQKTPDPWGIKRTPDVSADEVERWYSLRSRLSDLSRRQKWSKTNISKRSGIPQGTLWGWLDGTYSGVFTNVSQRVEQWLDSVEELNKVAATIPVAPGFVTTPSAQKMIDALLYAQSFPEIAVVTAGPGMGKTMTLNHYCGNRPHAYLATMRPMTKSVHGMMRQLAAMAELSKAESYHTHVEDAIGGKLRRNGKQTLIVIDEAQHLSDEAVNELRYFFDIYGIGIALFGNEELYGRFGDQTSRGGPAFAQLQSRFGLKLKLMRPLAGDIDALLDAWNIQDVEIRELVMAIGRRAGALRNITKTLQLAGMIAAGEARDMTPADIKVAAQNRGLEG